MNWRRGAAVLLIVLATALVASNRSAEAISPDLTFEGPAESGGMVSVTLTPDRQSLLAFEVRGVPLERDPCASEVWTEAIYFDPPVPVENGAFRASTRNLGTAHNMRALTIDGEVVSETRITGAIIKGGSIVCDTGPDVGFQLDGPIETPPGPDDVVYEGAHEGGTATLTLDPSRTSATSLALEDVSFGPCNGGQAVSVRAMFIPPMQIEHADDRPLDGRLVFVGDERSARWGINVDVIDEESLVLSVGWNDTSWDCLFESVWALSLVQEASPVANPTIAPSTPVAQPIAVAAPPRLPNTGAGSHAGARPPIAALAAATLLLIGAALLVRLRPR